VTHLSGTQSLLISPPSSGANSRAEHQPYGFSLLIHDNRFRSRTFAIWSGLAGTWHRAKYRSMKMQIIRDLY
jgi:hypothetical protein